MSKIDKFLVKQLKILYKALYNSLIVVLRIITKMIEMEKIKNSQALDIQILIDRKIKELKQKVEMRQKRNDKMQKRIERIKATIDRIGKSRK